MTMKSPLVSIIKVKAVKVDMRTLWDHLSSKDFTRLERDGYLLETIPASLMEPLLIKKMCKRVPKHS